MRPSRVMATFIRTKGRWCWLQRAKGSLRRRASAWQTPMVVWMPAALRALEAVAGDGGVGVDGGGDDSTDACGDEGLGAGRGAAGVVAGLEGDVGGAAFEGDAGLWAALRAATSAWSRRSYSCQPSPASWPSLSRRTQPTAGLGAVRAMPRRARARARCIQWRSGSSHCSVLEC